VADCACAQSPWRERALPQSCSKPVARRLLPLQAWSSPAGPVRHGAVRIGEARRGPARVLEAATPAAAGPDAVRGHGTVSFVSKWDPPTDINMAALWLVLCGGGTYRCHLQGGSTS
jgi:hypothetical protein